MPMNTSVVLRVPSRAVWKSWIFGFAPSSSQVAITIRQQAPTIALGVPDSGRTPSHEEDQGNRRHDARRRRYHEARDQQQQSERDQRGGALCEENKRGERHGNAHQWDHRCRGRARGQRAQEHSRHDRERSDKHSKAVETQDHRRGLYCLFLCLSLDDFVKVRASVSNWQLFTLYRRQIGHAL